MNKINIYAIYYVIEFRNKKSSILVATDVAARGLGKSDESHYCVLFS